MPTESELITEQTDTVLRIAFNRPQSLNALTTGMMNRAADAIEASAGDSGVRTVLLTGTGRAFSAGAALSAGEKPDADTIDAANRLTTAIRQIPKPVVAAVNGLAAGVGCSFALAADLAIARHSAYFLLAFANIGLMPDGGATALLPATIGRARTARMAMLAERVPAQQAADWGLISHVVPDDAYDSLVDDVVTRLASGPTAAFARMKQAINESSSPHLEQALASERAGQAALFETDDYTEGVAAFLGKRTPRFAGR